MNESLLFTTSSGSHLSPTVLDNVPNIRPGLYRLGSFIDGEVMFYLDEPVKGLPCFVLGHTGPPADNLLQMMTIINTLKINGAKPIIAVIPYLGYSRSDRNKPLQPINSRLFSAFLKNAGISKLICLDLHSLENEKYLTFPHLHLSALPLLADQIKNLHIPSLAVVTPDKGGLRRAQQFAKYLDIANITKITKYRPSDTTAETLKIEGEVNNHNVVVVDDMIQTGNTLLAAAKLLKQKGARDIYACATHLLPQINNIKPLTSTSIFKRIFVTNSLTNHKDLPTKISEIDISPLLAATIAKELQQF